MMKLINEQLSMMITLIILIMGVLTVHHKPVLGSDSMFFA